MIKDPHKFNDERVQEACGKAFIKKLRENPKFRNELGISALPSNASYNFKRFSAMTVDADDRDPNGAHLICDIDGFVEHFPVLGTACVQLSGLNSEVMDWKSAENVDRGYIFGLKFKAEILSYKPIKYAKASA